MATSPELALPYCHLFPDASIATQWHPLPLGPPLFPFPPHIWIARLIPCIFLSSVIRGVIDLVGSPKSLRQIVFPPAIVVGLLGHDPPLRPDVIDGTGYFRGNIATPQLGSTSPILVTPRYINISPGPILVVHAILTALSLRVIRHTRQTRLMLWTLLLVNLPYLHILEGLTFNILLFALLYAQSYVIWIRASLVAIENPCPTPVRSLSLLSGSAFGRVVVHATPPLEKHATVLRSRPRLSVIILPALLTFLTRGTPALPLVVVASIEILILHASLEAFVVVQHIPLVRNVGVGVVVGALSSRAQFPFLRQGI